MTVGGRDVSGSCFMNLYSGYYSERQDGLLEVFQRGQSAVSLYGRTEKYVSSEPVLAHWESAHRDDRDLHGSGI